MAWEGHQADTRAAVGVLVMAKRSRRKKSQPPKFPRRRWTTGQVERVETPKKGGHYDRARRRRRTEEDAEESQEQE